MDYMCEGIVIEILARLPAKSLVRFMAVCRLWKSIITSPQFRLHSKRPTKLLMHTDQGIYSLLEENRLTFETDFPSNQYSYDSAAKVIGSDNGLLCIRISDPGRVIICNPFIRKHVVIPLDDKITCRAVCANGFGGTTSGGDYKYVSVVGFYDGEGVLKKVVDIYSLKTDTWRRKYLDWDITQGMQEYFCTCALVRGRLHWIDGEGKEIFSFELEDEVFDNKIMVPESIRPPGKNVYFKVTEIWESLAVITTELAWHSCTECVWVMKEYGDVNSWIKLCNIDLEEYYCVERNMVHLLNDDEVLLGLVRSMKYPHKRKLVTYNSKKMITMEFGGGGSFSSLPRVCGFTNYYKESLVLLADDYRAAADHPTLHGL